MKKQKWFVMLALLVVSGCSYAQSGVILPFKLNARVAYVVDAETNEVLIDKGSQQIRPIASITKLMTAMVVLDAKQSLDEEIVISQEEVEATKVRRRVVNGRKNLPVGQTLTRAELLHLALMNSQNRAAAALARTYPGGTEALVAAMNAKAHELGMYNTHYVDPTGLFNENVSTAEDLTLLVKAASGYELIRDFSTATSFELTMYSKKKQKHAKKVEFGTTNRLVRMDEWKIFVQKTGYITNSGHCVVMMATMGAKKVIVVLLNTISNTARAADASNIKRYVETGEVPLVKKVRVAKIKVKKPAPTVVVKAEEPARPVIQTEQKTNEKAFYFLLFTLWNKS